ncbi:BSD domain-containing protein [Euphorbia peplus]|nr:BSD domain-containing protein [Euphorbia peplus]
MEWSWWFGRSNKKNQTPNESLHKEEEEEEQLLGFTQQLIDHVNSFTLHTFLNFPLKDESSNSTDAANSDNVQKDLSNWQERHATLVLSKLKELSQLRFKLCPRHLKERDFWRIYFLLVKSHVSV